MDTSLHTENVSAAISEMQVVVDMLEKAMLRIKVLETRLCENSSIETHCFRKGLNQVDVVHEVLQVTDDDGLSVSEISKFSGIPQPSVRVVLYSNKDRFKPERLSPRKVRWHLLGDEDSYAKNMNNFRQNHTLKAAIG